VPAGVFPSFRYHPAPLATGAFEVSARACECCGQSRGYAYTRPVYSTREVTTICPWCIADGSVVKLLDGMLNDDRTLRSAGLPDSIIEEVCCRTPGYVSWQGDSWIACCNDACEFHGDAPAEELQALNDGGRIALSSDSGFSVDDLPDILERYEPGGSPAFYKFICRHCGVTRYRGDCD
jgi:uncharacterized protein